MSPRVQISGSQLYLAFLGIVGGFNGILLWPAVVVHAILTALLARDQREANLEKT